MMQYATRWYPLLFAAEGWKRCAPAVDHLCHNAILDTLLQRTSKRRATCYMSLCMAEFQAHLIRSIATLAALVLFTSVAALAGQCGVRLHRAQPHWSLTPRQRAAQGIDARHPCGVECGGRGFSGAPRSRRVCSQQSRGPQWRPQNVRSHL